MLCSVSLVIFVYRIISKYTLSCVFRDGCSTKIQEQGWSGFRTQLNSISTQNSTQLSNSLSWRTVLRSQLSRKRYSTCRQRRGPFSNTGATHALDIAATMDTSWDCRRHCPKWRRPRWMAVPPVCSHRPSFPHSPRSQGRLIGLMGKRRPWWRHTERNCGSWRARPPVGQAQDWPTKRRPPATRPWRGSRSGLMREYTCCTNRNRSL